MALIPSHRPVFFAVVIGMSAIVGGAVSLFATAQLLSHDWTKYKQDHLAYGLLPTLAYVALLAAAAMIWKENEYALVVLAGGLLLLLVMNVRNAWDLTLSMVRQHKKK